MENIKLMVFLNLKNDDRRNMGLCGRQHVERFFSRNIVINAYKVTIDMFLRD